MPTDSPIVDSQNTTFTFAGSTFLAKNVKVKIARATVDVTPLSQAAGTMRKLQIAPLQDNTQITCEYFGTTTPTIGSSGAVACSTLGISGNAFCEDFELTAAVGELVMGNLTLKMTG
jgi:hypothetical protein